MYRMSMEVEQRDNIGGSEFVTRLSELPVSQMALMQLSALYDRAREQRLLALGLKAGEGTLSLAAKVATPIVSMLPVSSLDSLACKQLEYIEQVMPAIKKDPKQLMVSKEELVNKAMAPAYSTVSAVKQISYNTVEGVKNFAVETSAPTVERVGKVTTYSMQTIEGMKSGVATTYEGAKSTVAKLCTTEGVKDTFNTTYDTVRGFDYGKVREFNMDTVRHGIEHGKEGMMNGVKAGVEGAKAEAGSYATATFQPTATRVLAARQYGVDKVQETIDGVKSMGNQVMESVYNNRLVNTVNGTLSGALGYAEHALDQLLPPDPEDEDETSAMHVAGEEIHPASPQAGSWTRSMMLMSNLNRRLYTHGERKYKQYSQQAADVSDYVQTRYQTNKEYAQTAYRNSYDYITASYNSARQGLSNTRDHAVYAYDSVKKRWTMTQDTAGRLYDGTQKRWTTTKENAVYFYDAARKRWTQSYDFTTNGYASAQARWSKRQEYGTELKSRAQEGWTGTKRRLTDAWQHPADFASTSYEATKTGFVTTRNFTVAAFESMVKGTRASVAFTSALFIQTRKRSSDAVVVVKDTWSVTHSRVAGFYGFVSEWAVFVTDEAKNTYLYRRMFPMIEPQSSERCQLKINEAGSATGNAPLVLDYVPVSSQDGGDTDTDSDSGSVDLENSQGDIEMRDLSENTSAEVPNEATLEE